MNLGEGRDHLTICSVSTPMGYGGISVIRISGQKAYQIVLKSLKKHPELTSHKAFLSEFLNTSTGKTIDEVLVLPFDQGKSFTGEESVEISCHGSPVICSAILNELCRNGASLAVNGEFTYRAFMNDRMDLIQAESVLSLIHSHSELGVSLALKQLKGELSERISTLKENIIWCLAHIEAGIDFSAEDITVVEDTVLIKKLDESLNDLSVLINTYETGRVLRDGIALVLSGEPNVGKSSLMNVLLKSDRSIVSDIAGTTRDVVKEDILYKNLKFTLVDTAGIRAHSNDPIEMLGVGRSLKERGEGIINLVVLDISNSISAQENIIFDGLDLERTIFILNKSDLLNKNQVAEMTSRLETRLKVIFGKNGNSVSPGAIAITSSLDSNTRNQILDMAYNLWTSKFAHVESVAVSSSRQNTELRAAEQLLVKVIDGLRNQLGSEFIAFDLKGSLMALQRVVGEVYDDQILDKVFKEFCLGK